MNADVWSLVALFATLAAIGFGPALVVIVVERTVRRARAMRAARTYRTRR